MSVRKTLLLGAAAAAFSLPASAGHFKGWYVGLEGGGSWIDNTDAFYQRTISVVNQSDDGVASFEAGWTAFASIGYAFASNWRVEGEFGYRDNDVSARWLIFDNFFDLTGDVEEYSLMANVLYDFQLGERLALSIGAGAGGDNVRLAGAISGFPAGPVQVSDDRWRFAAQAIAGLNYALSPRWDLTLTYRYLHVEGPAFTQSINIFAAPVTQTVTFDDLHKHSVSVGLRFDLAADEAPVVAPPPPPPPPPPAVKQFIIFFAFDRCDITAEADRVLGEAAATAKSTGSASVRVVGHTDTSGSAAHNQRLSECRAKAAKTKLVGKGIPDGAISTSGRGEAELMVQTGDGVKEPQNRRATVDLQ